MVLASHAKCHGAHVATKRNAIRKNNRRIIGPGGDFVSEVANKAREREAASGVVGQHRHAQTIGPYHQGGLGHVEARASMTASLVRIAPARANVSCSFLPMLSAPNCRA